MNRQIAAKLAAYIVFFAGLGFAAWRGMLAFDWFGEWRQARISDPSAAELFQVNGWFETGFAFIGLIVAATALHLIRRKGARRNDS